MCPTDTTPDPRGMERMPESQEIPQAPRGSGGPPDIAHRPGLPEHPERMAADLDDANEFVDKERDASDARGRT